MRFHFTQEDVVGVKRSRYLGLNRLAVTLASQPYNKAAIDFSELKDRNNVSPQRQEFVTINSKGLRP